MIEARTGHYHVRGLRLAYHAWGDENAPPIVMLHGFQDHGLSYARTAAELAGKYFIVAPDLRGHGQSEWVGAGGDYHFYDYFYDVLALADRLGLEKYCLAGHSMGGNVASGVGAISPARISRMVLLEGMGFQTHDLADTVGRLQRWAATLARDVLDLGPAERKAARVKMVNVEDAAERLRRYNLRLSVERSIELASSFIEAFEDGVAWRFDPLHKVPSAKPYLFDEIAAMWRGLDMPVLSLYGSDSPWIPPNLDERFACIRDLRSALIEGAGHNVHHDQPEALARAIELWMNDPKGVLPEGVREGRPSAPVPPQS